MSSPGSTQQEQRQLAEAIHASGGRMTLVATGGGSLAFSALLTVPGASRSVLETVVPYSAAALRAYLLAKPEQYCNELTARQMAMAAYQRAQTYLLENDSNALKALPAAANAGSAVGVGCTCSLASDRPKRGAHRIHAAAQTQALTATATLDLIKDARSRLEEEELAAALTLNLAALACGVAERVTLALRPGERVEEHRANAPAPWRQLFAGERKIAPSTGVDEARTAQGARRVIFPGAFHPLHAGHHEMARVAEARLGAPVEWEISIANVDKPPIDYREMELRAAQFVPPAKLWFTWAPTFASKTELFPNCTFVVGADTIDRIGEPRYYHDDPAARDEAIRQIAAAGCRFLVFGRVTDEGFQTSADLELPPALRALCDDVPAEEFRRDISSTELRRSANDAEQASEDSASKGSA